MVPRGNVDWDGLFTSSGQRPGILPYNVLWYTGQSCTKKKFLTLSVSGVEVGTHCSDVLTVKGCKHDELLVELSGLSTSLL